MNTRVFQKPKNAGIKPAATSLPTRETFQSQPVAAGFMPARVAFCKTLSLIRKVRHPIIVAMAIACAIVAVRVALLYSQSLQSGYVVVTSDSVRPAPVGAALFSYSVGGVLVSQAGVGSAEPIQSGRIFVDQAPGIRTGLVLVNPNSASAAVTLTLRDAAGTQISQQVQMLTAGQHLARFADELLTTIPPGFTGSLTFASAANLAALTLRESRNGRNESLYTTLPVANLASVARDPVVFPHIAAGGEYTTQIVLINRSASAISGQVRLFANDGRPLPLDSGGTTASDFAYQIEANGVYRRELGNSQGLVVGYAVATPAASDAPAGTAIFQFKRGGQIVTEAGVASTSGTALARIFVDQAGSRTGVAIANTNNAAANLNLTLMDRFGSEEARTDRTIPANGHEAYFVDEIFAGLPAGFTGLLEIRSSLPVSPITLKVAANPRGDNILTTLPVADLNSIRTATTIIFPQIAFGSGFSTRLIFINSDRTNAASGRMQFYGDSGTPLSLFMSGIQSSQFDYRFSGGASRQFLPGNTATPAGITLLDASYRPTSEFTINEGDSGRPRLLISDSTGAFRDDFDVTISSSNPDVAFLNSDGTILGKVRGFSTLRIAAGNTVQAFVATVTAIGAGSPGFGASTGVAQDSSQRLYLTATDQHTILLAQSVSQAPSIFAGTDRSPGLKNGPRQQAQFRNPSRLAINHYDGSLYVSDAANNVIRRIRAGTGTDGPVDTLAGSGVAGAANGRSSEAAFRNPQGIALDNNGQLWVADSDNHSIRRINLSAGRVETIAGESGQAGIVDGQRQAARFRRPVGLTVEPEPLALQLQRQRQRLPVPPVRVIVADTGNNALRRVYDDGRVETLGAASPGALVIGQATAIGKTNSQSASTFAALPLNGPEDVAADPFGTIYVTEPGGKQVRALLPNGEVVAAAGAGSFNQPKGVAISQTGRLVVADTSPREIHYGEPVITSITPDRVSARDGGNITIRGRNFAPGSLLVVGGVVITSINANVSNTESISFVIPSLPSGRTTVSIQNRGGLGQIGLLLEAVPLSQLPPGHITTVAGGSTYVGDGGLAEHAPLTPISVAVDASGNLLIADLFNHRIRRIDARTRIITSVAGNGIDGYSGDGELAITAALNTPSAIAVDGGGDLFIADQYNQVIRRVDATGVISTFAGTGNDGFSGNNGPATAADLNLPAGVAVDTAGNLFIADTGNNQIRRVDTNRTITTVVGNGTRGFAGDNGPAVNASLDQPSGLAFDSEGRLLIADVGNNRIRRLERNGTITTIAGDGQTGFSPDGTPARNAQLSGPQGLSVDADGNIFVAEAYNCRILKISVVDTRITTVAGSGECDFYGDGEPATSAALQSPRSVAVDAAGNVFIADLDNLRVRRVDAKTRIISTLAGIGDGAFLGDDGPATSAVITYPLAIIFDSSGNLIIGDTDNRVRKVDANTGVITTLAGGGPAGQINDGQLATNADLFAPSGLAFDRDGNLYIADNGHSRIRKVDARTRIITTIAGTGQEGFSGDNGPATAATLTSPRNLAIDANGNLYIGDDGNLRIRKVDLTTGIITTYAGNGRRGFSGDGGPANLASLSAAWNFVLDSSGNLYFCDYDNKRIRKVDRNGIISSPIGGDTSDTEIYPITLAFDRLSNLYVMEVALQRIIRFSTNTSYTAVAGNGNAGYSGDGGPALAATLSYPVSMAFDRAGNLFIADYNNSRIRAIRAPIP